jgi:menaquinone-9 beta-reductase
LALIFRQGQVKEPLLDGDGRVVGVRARLNGQWQEIRSRVVIAADGVTSTIARALRGDQTHQDGHRAIALRAYIEDIAELPHEVEFYLYNAILPGYAWIFPLGEGRANIGLGMRLDRFRGMKQSLEEMLQAFLGMPAVKERLRNGGQLKDIATWQLNFGSQKKLQHAFNGALLAGDAAGFINPLTGGGIHNGLLSAKIAAEVVDDALRRGDLSQASLQLYERLCEEAMAKDMNKAYFLQRLLLHFPFIVDLIVRWAGKDSALAQTFVQKL